MGYLHLLLEDFMKLNKIISVISLGVTGAAFPLSVVFNSYKKLILRASLIKLPTELLIKIKQIPKY